MKILSGYGAVFAALALLMRYILRVTIATVTDEKMIGKRIGFLGWQKSAGLLLDELASPFMVDGSGQSFRVVVF